MRELLLCQKVPDPPGNVDFSLFNDPDAPSRTARQRLSVHATQPSCAGCHKLTDPIGLALERIDGAGQLRSTENDIAIDPSGDLDGGRAGLRGQSPVFVCHRARAGTRRKAAVSASGKEIRRRGLSCPGFVARDCDQRRAVCRIAA
jgi:hypothetical protein